MRVSAQRGRLFDIRRSGGKMKPKARYPQRQACEVAAYGGRH